jgi:hypothetical protein
MIKIITVKEAFENLEQSEKEIKESIDYVKNQRSGICIY